MRTCAHLGLKTKKARIMNDTTFPIILGSGNLVKIIFQRFEVKVTPQGHPKGHKSYFSIFCTYCLHTTYSTGQNAKSKISFQISDCISIQKMYALYNLQKTGVYDIVGWTIFIYIYIYIYMSVCVCLCVCVCARGTRARPTRAPPPRRSGGTRCARAGGNLFGLAWVLL